MLENNNANTIVPSNSRRSYILSMYDNLFQGCSTRTRIILRQYEDTFSDRLSFLEALLNLSSKEISELKNCGKKTVTEILSIQRSLRIGNLQVVGIEPQASAKTLPANIDSILPLVTLQLNDLSARARNAFLGFLREHKNSLSDLYATICDRHFSPYKLRSVGRGTADEIGRLMVNLRSYLESFSDEQSIENAISSFYSKSLSDIHIPIEQQERILSLKDSLGYFPLFAAIEAYFSSMEGRCRMLLDECLLIHVGQTISDRDKVATALKLTSERVRQMRNRLILKLSDYYSSIKSEGFVDKCPYSYQMTRLEKTVNALEGTNFNLNFINWVLGSTFKEVTMLGDVTKTIGGFYDKEYFLCLVPTDLCQYMDFNAFLEDLDARLAEKRVNEERVSLQNLISNHLKTQYCEDEMPAIETACRSILYLHYPVEVDYGQVIFKPNTRKNNPIIIEEIIRAAGHPLSLEEIYEEFIYQYPERFTEMTSFRGNIANNPNVIPIGRTSTYTLAEWEGTKHKGGTIRKMICEYLDALEAPIAPADEVGKYVRRFRPDSSDSSISSNLLQERSHRFVILIKDGKRYYGYSNHKYNSSYRIIGGGEPTKRSAAQSMIILEDFIVASGHYPFWVSNDENEKRLYRFVRNRRTAYNRGDLSEDEARKWSDFEEKYREYDFHGESQQLKKNIED